MRDACRLPTPPPLKTPATTPVSRRCTGCQSVCMCRFLTQGSARPISSHRVHETGARGRGGGGGGLTRGGASARAAACAARPLCRKTTSKHAHCSSCVPPPCGTCTPTPLMSAALPPLLVPPRLVHAAPLACPCPPTPSRPLLLLPLPAWCSLGLSQERGHGRAKRRRVAAAWVCQATGGGRGGGCCCCCGAARGGLARPTSCWQG